MDKSYLYIDGVMAGQTPNAVNVFPNIIKDFDTIIEIGTGRGAFTSWLEFNKSSKCKIISYDINSSRNQFKELKVDFRVQDCFSCTEDIKNIIVNGGKVLLLCDGGNKEKEFNTFAHFLKLGDVIMAHDYSESKNQYSELQKKLNWKTASETHLHNIQKTIDSLSLKPYYYENFKNVLWASFIRSEN